jgi:histidinol-phosphate aminotransferase
MEKKLVRIAKGALEIESCSRSRTVQEPSPSATLLKLDENENTVGPSPEVSEALNEYLRTRPLNWHKGARPEEQLRRKISEYLSLPQEAISCFNGSLGAADSIIRTYLEPGTEMIVDSPSDRDVQNLAFSVGADIVSIEHANPLRPQIETVINRITPRTRMIYLSNPNGLTGAAYSESEIIFLLAYAERVMVVVQEDFAEFCGCSMTDLVMRFSNIAVIRSFSGAFGLASLPAAFVLTDPDNIEFIDRLKIANVISDAACVAACAALDDSAHTRKYVQAVDQSKRMLVSNLPQLGFDFHLGPANFILLKVADAHAAAKLLTDQGVLIGDFSYHDSLQGYIRITLGTPSQMERLLMILSRMAASLATGFNRNRQEMLINRTPLRIKILAPAE